MANKESLDELRKDTYINENLSIAKKEISKGNADKAINILCNVIVYIFSKEPVLSTKVAEKVIDKKIEWNLPGSQLSTINNQLSIELTRSAFSTKEAYKYFEYILYLFEFNKEFNVKTIISRSIRTYSSKFIGYILKFLWVDTANRTYKSIYKYAKILENRVSYKSQHHIDLNNSRMNLLSYLFNEPSSKCNQIIIEHRAEMYLLDERRNRVRSLKNIITYRNSFNWPQQIEYEKFINYDTRSRIIVTFHLGDYINALSRLMESSENGRRRIVIRFENTFPAGKTNTQVEFEAMNNKTINEFDSKKLKAIEIVSMLKHGNTTLTTFCDLSMDHGISVDVKLLGKHAKFSKGPAQISLASHSPIIPMITYSDMGINKIHMGDVIEPNLVTGETLSTGVQRITQTLVKFFEGYLKQYPEQWRYLPNIDKYLLMENINTNNNQ